MPVLYQGKMIAGSNTGGVSDIQTKLEGSPGQVVGFDANGNAIAILGWSNQNLLDNWYFGNPINQRGKTEYTGLGHVTDRGYTIDRWAKLAKSPNVNVANNGVSFGNGDFGQKMLTSDLPIGTYTISALTASNKLATTTFSITADTQQHSYTAYFDESHSLRLIFFYKWQLDTGLSLFFFQNNSDTFSEIIVAAKLELGCTQTLAHQENGVWILNEIPDYGTELLKCQRYYYQSLDEKSPYTMLAVSRTMIIGSVIFPVRMRKIKLTGFDADAYTMDGAWASSNAKMYSYNETGLYSIDMHGVEPFEPGQMYQVRFRVNAEL